jgi:hypothetical protein
MSTMFAALTSSAASSSPQQPRRSLATTLEAHKDSSASDDDDDENKAPSMPLKGIVACLTGMSHTEKNKYHEWIEALGGTYTRDFQTSRNTHLIAQTTEGEKYKVAILESSIYVVQPSWLEACFAKKCRVEEAEYSWKRDPGKRKKISAAAINNGNNKKPKQDLLSYLTQCLKIDNPDQNKDLLTPRPLFDSCQFYLVGFGDSTNGEKERIKLSQLIRRGMGTIFWEFQEGVVTHVIVHDDSSDAVRYVKNSGTLFSIFFSFTLYELIHLKINM